MDRTQKTQVVMSCYNTRGEVKRRAKLDAAAASGGPPTILPFAHKGFHNAAVKASQCVSVLGAHICHLMHQLNCLMWQAVHRPQ